MLRVSLFIVGAVFVLTGCGKPPEPAPAPRTVKVFTVGQSVESDPSADTVTMPSAIARDPAALAFDAGGRVMAVMVAVGDEVRSGQALARLDPRDLALSESSAKVQFDAAQAELEFAESDFRRYADLHTKGFISKAELDRRRAQLQVARARFESTAEQLGFITLRAIEPGVVQSVLIRSGSAVQPRQVAVMLKVSGVTQARSSGARSAGISIPLSSLIDGKAVYKIINQTDGSLRLSRVDVSLGQVSEQSAEVRHGLSRGDRIVAAGTHLLADGESVRIFNP
ncbi:MAG: biotin/lipoyl-binding protein [Betaproteobacteria bacterium]|jgi:multidrug efflux pump subunit AcrA (membrane-fusion protein)|nr:biotin/lipoyl-binding protein [Betaproteobacteria bacterium]